jgi:cell division protein FtsI/penicillin-binding protein 2
MSRTKAGLVLLVLALAAGAGVFYVLQGNDEGDPNSAAEDYLDAWAADDVAAMQDLVVEVPSDFEEVHQALAEDLGIEEARYEVSGVSVDGDEAIATYDATLTLAGLGEWSYDGRLRLARGAGDDGDVWLVDWTPAAIHPQLRDGQTLGLTRHQPERAAILDDAGEPLVTNQPGRIVGLQPSRIQNLQQVKDALQTALGVDPALVDERLNAPGVQPDHFVEIITIPNSRYDQVEAAIYPVPGTVFRDTNVRMGPSQGFAQHVLGTIGEITAEQLEELGSGYQAGDIVGHTGLEARFEEQLAGTPSGDVEIRDAAGDVVEVLDTIEGTEPEPVRTTLNRDIQLAVEAALASVGKPAGIVVTDRDGNIKAAASRPLDEEFNRAFAGTYAPGSTFKIVSTEALLTSGLTPETTVDCPATLNAGGRQFRNFEASSLGQVPFQTAFAESCNTAFINATTDLPAADLVSAAERFGFNTDYSVGLSTEGGEVPVPTDATDKAAATIGQSRILASPLHMATVAGTVIDGTWEPPTLLPDNPPDDAPEPTEIDAAHRDTLAALMRRVVTDGSGQAAAVPGREVAGKTGTAEYGSDTPPRTHAWFVGFLGDYAMALVIEDGGVGGRDAAPVAQQVLAQLPAG